MKTEEHLCINISWKQSIRRFLSTCWFLVPDEINVYGTGCVTRPAVSHEKSRWLCGDVLTLCVFWSSGLVMGMWWRWRSEQLDPVPLLTSVLLKPLWRATSRNVCSVRNTTTPCSMRSPPHHSLESSSWWQKINTNWTSRIIPCLRPRWTRSKTLQITNSLFTQPTGQTSSMLYNLIH